MNGASRSVSELNRATYQRLKLSLSLNLRRQIFLAICDDLPLRNRLAAKLYAQLAYPVRQAAPAPAIASAYGLIGMPSVEHSSALEYPRFVNLSLDLYDPNLMNQVMRWLRRYPPPQDGSLRHSAPGFQILGLENLTRQPAFVQQQFLFDLQELGRSPNPLDSSLLLWLTRPWFFAIQQSAPAFWNCHTALFEFEGDPTPISDGPPAASPSLAAANWTATPAAPAAPIDLSPEPIVPPTELPDAPAIEASRAAELDTPVQVKADRRWERLIHEVPLADDEPTGTVTPADTPATETLPASAQVVDVEARSETVDRIEADRVAVEIEPDAPLPALAPSEASAAIAPAASSEPLDDQLAYLISQTYPNLADLIHAAIAPTNGEPVPHAAEAIAILQQIEQLHQQQAEAIALAAAYQSLGNLYRDRIEQGDTTESTLVVAIYAYEQLLTRLDAANLDPSNLNAANSQLWSDVLNDLGNLYWMLARQLPDADRSVTYLEQGIAAYQLALRRTHPQARSQSYAMIQNNLGSAYGDLARYRDPATTLQRSVQAYEEALRYRKPTEDPARYAATQNNLGTTYWNLAQHQQPIQHLQQAIAAYQEALSYYSEAREPLHFAMIQNNLGTAYWNLAQHDPAIAGKSNGKKPTHSAIELLDWAIKAYHTALVHRTMEVSPAAHAATQNNLGTAYWHLATLPSTSPADRREQLQQAIAAYEAALAAVDFLRSAAAHPPAFTFDPLATQNNLGLAYYQLATAKQVQPTTAERTRYLEASLHHHLQALQGWTNQPSFYETALEYVVQTMRAFYSECGLNGQSLALSKVPAHLLPEVMRRM